MAPRWSATLILSCCFLGAAADNWAVIVAGSNGFGNYRHQADACHAYQTLKSKGFPVDNIILMAYDDIADNEENPFPGKLFNKPDPEGPGEDVYGGCNIDYKKNTVNSKTFLDVMLGKASGKSLKSTAEDNVFVNFVDHGAPGIVAFPDDVLHKKDLQSTLRQMAEARMFKKLVFYLEACESGSMFEGMNITGVYGLSASNPHESSWGTYCSGDDDKVNGKSIGSCLGDLFSVNWMEDSDEHDITKETLTAQFQKVKQLTTKSHVLQYGDLSFGSDDVSDFLGSSSSTIARSQATPLQTATISARKIDLQSRYQQYDAAETSSHRLVAVQRLRLEVQRQESADRVYRRLAEMAYPDDEAAQKQVRRRQESPDFPECELASHNTLFHHCDGVFSANSGFALQFHQVIVNICSDVKNKGLNFDVPSSAAVACTEERTRVASMGGASEIVV